MPFNEKAQQLYDRMESATTRDELLQVHTDAGEYVSQGGNFTSLEMAALAGAFTKRNVELQDASLPTPALDFPPPAPEAQPS